MRGIRCPDSLRSRKSVFERAEANGLRAIGYKIILELIVRLGGGASRGDSDHVRDGADEGRSKLTLGVRGAYVQQLAMLGWFDFRVPCSGGCWCVPRCWWCSARVIQNGWLDYDDKYHVIDNAHFRVMSWESFAFFWRERTEISHPARVHGLGRAGENHAVVDACSRDGDAEPCAVQGVKPLLHACSAVCVMGILRMLGAKNWAAVCGAMLLRCILC